MMDEPIYTQLRAEVIKRECECAMTEASLFECPVHGLHSVYTFLF